MQQRSINLQRKLKYRFSVSNKVEGNNNKNFLCFVTEFGKSPYTNVKEFEEMGYNMVIFPLTAFRVMLKSVADTLSKLKAEGSQETFIEEMMTRKELYEIIGYEDYEVFDKKISEKIK